MKILFVVLCLKMSFAQTKELDSLRELVYEVSSDSQIDEDYVGLLFEYHKAYLTAVNYDSMQSIANRANVIASELNSSVAKGKAQMMLGRLYSKKKQNDKALKHYLKGEALIHGLEDVKLSYHFNSEIGGIYFSKGYLNKDLDSALYFFEKAFEQAVHIEVVHQAKSLHQLVLVYLLIGNVEVAKSYIEKYTGIVQEDEVKLYYNVSMMNFYEFQNNKDSALFYGRENYQNYFFKDEVNYDVSIWGLIKYANCYYSFYEDDSAKVYFEGAISKAITRGDVVSYSKAFGPLNFLYSVEDKPDKSMEICQQAINWGHKVGDSALIAQALYNSTFVYGKLNNYEKAIDLYEELLGAYKDFLPIPIEVVYTNLSYNYYERGMFLEAVKYGGLAKVIDSSNPTTLYNLADALLAGYKDSTVQQTEMVKLLDKESKALSNGGEVDKYVLQLVYDNYMEAVELIKNKTNNRTIVHPYYGLGDYFDFVGNKTQAVYYYEQSWNAAEGTEMMELSNKIKIANKLYSFYKNDQKEVDNALKWIETLDSLKDEEKKSANLELIGRKQAEFEYSQKIYADSLEVLKEKEINSLKEEQKANQRTLIISFSAFMTLLLVVLMYLFFRRKELKAENRLVNLEQKLLRTQMNPHFIFNSLTTIGSYIISNRVNESYNYISQFSKLIRLILESSREEVITLEEEMLIVNNFLSLHQMNKKERLQYSLNYDKTILDKEIVLPPMLLQPFIENAVKYGEDKVSKTCLVEVEFKLLEKELYCSVRDFGGGFDVKREKEETSYSIQITKERIHSIKKQLGKDVKLNIIDFTQDKSGEKGVLVEIFVQV